MSRYENGEDSSLSCSKDLFKVSDELLISLVECLGEDVALGPDVFLTVDS